MTDVTIRDMDKLLKSVESQMPIVNSEQVYKWELMIQMRVYLVLTALGTLLTALGVLI
jgi:hypothetical protein